MSCQANRRWCPLRSSASDFSLRAVTLAMWSSTDFADVLVFARQGLFLAFAIVPQSAWVSLSPSGSSSRFLGRFLRGVGTAFASAMPLEVTSLEVSEFTELIEGNIVDGPDTFTNGFVKLKYLPMSAGM